MAIAFIYSRHFYNLLQARASPLSCFMVSLLMLGIATTVECKSKKTGKKKGGSSTDTAGKNSMPKPPAARKKGGLTSTQSSTHVLTCMKL